MVEGFSKLLFAEMVGECLRSFFGLPVPGPVIGMFLLAIAIVVRRRVTKPTPLRGDRPTERAADALITHMGLLFVPAGVGIIAVAPSLHAAWIALGIALIASTLITLVVTGGAMHCLIPRAETGPSGRTALMKSDHHV